MQIIKLKRTVNLAILIGAAVLMLSFAVSAQSDRMTGPALELPPQCSAIQVPAGSQLVFRSYALGVQIYRWNGTKWDFVAPAANLYSDPNFRGKIGDHYAGPTWQSSNGSNVVAARVDGCTPDATAIPWLLLRSVSNDGKGLFHDTSFIQRLNTAGGLEPSAPGTSVGQEYRVPYVAEYYFYRTGN